MVIHRWSLDTICSIETCPMNERFTKQMHLRSSRDFERVYASRIFAADETLVVSAIRNSLQYSRLGLSVSRKVGNAVARNRWKRLIRESYRRIRISIPTGLDIVVRPRHGGEPDFRKIVASLESLLQRLDKPIHKSGSSVNETEKRE